MKKIEISIPENEQRLESAIKSFVLEEFREDAQFSIDSISPELKYKDPTIGEIGWITLQVIATVEGSLQFSERIGRVERVKKLMKTINEVGKSVYVKIGEADIIDLLGMDIDDIMNIL